MWACGYGMKTRAHEALGKPFRDVVGFSSPAREGASQFLGLLQHCTAQCALFVKQKFLAFWRSWFLLFPVASLEVVPSHSSMALATSATLHADVRFLSAPRRCVSRRVPRASSRRPHPTTAKLFYDANALGGDSAELKAAHQLRRLFTYVAIRIVQGHIEGIGNDGGFAPQATGWDGSSNCPDYEVLRWHMENVPLGDGDEWISALMKENPVVALRILEARKAYCDEFDYRTMRECVDEVVGEGNVRLMQEHATASLNKEK